MGRNQPALAIGPTTVAARIFERRGMAASALMFQGTGSDVGKSLIVAGLCRAAAKRGIKVRPFKPQNMSNNAAVATGGEIGRAQALQARACGVAASVLMNPVLLKPETDRGSQLILRGKMTGRLEAKDFRSMKDKLLGEVLESFHELAADADLVLVEGAGSPAETNLRSGDIANMGFAEAADIPVVLVSDISRGGVIASLVGTHHVLPPAEQQRIKGFIINKFRGDPSLFEEGMAEIEQRTGWHGFGIAPWFEDAARLPAEDAVALETEVRQSGGKIRVVMPRLARIANFEDLDPLAQEPDVDVVVLNPGEVLPADIDLVLIPGSKSTIGDLNFMRAQGWDIDIQAHVRRGGKVLGLCGGYQMLGKKIRDKDGIEGPAGEVDGLGLLDIETDLSPEKAVREASGTSVDGEHPVSGYEIHIGRTSGPDCERPMIRLGDGRADGAISADKRVMGCYLHGLLANDGYRRAFLATLNKSARSELQFDLAVEQALDDLADHLTAHLDFDHLLDTSTQIREL